MASIFSRDFSSELALTPRDLIAGEIRHLENTGRSRWRTNPFMAACRTVGITFFFVVLALYILDPFLFAIHKTRAINAYLYLSHYGAPTDVQPLEESGIFSTRDLRLLGLRAQLPASSIVEHYYTGTTDARAAVTETLAYMHELNALHSGNLENTRTLTQVRYHLFTRYGIIPPREWLSMSPVIEE